MVKFHLGLNNCWAIKRWPVPSEWADLYRKMDVKNVQFSFDLLDPRSKPVVLEYGIGQVNDAVAKYGLYLQSTFTGLIPYSMNFLAHPDPVMRADALDWYMEAIRVTKLLGAKMTGGHMGAKSVADYEDKARANAVDQALFEAVKSMRVHAKQEGLEALLWEPMPVPRETPWSLEEASLVLKRANEGEGVPLKLAIDMGHQCTLKGSDGDPYRWLAQLGAESPVIHLQQTDGKADRHWPFAREYNEIGIMKPDKVIESLERSGAKEVYAFVEYIPPSEEDDKKVLENVEETVKLWKEYAQDRGQCPS
ncbi:sugar phosphate isomerase/epimerase family protein [Tardisphaera saccharovorans]